MARFAGFTGPAYQSESQTAALERTVNYYQESPEVPNEQKPGPWLYPRAGSKQFGPVPAVVPLGVREMIEFDGNGVLDGAVFGVSGSRFWQLGADGTQTDLGAVIDDGLPAIIEANAASVGQVAVASGGRLYVLNDGIFAEIPIGDDFFGARGLAFMDGYFAVLSDVANHQQFQICSLNNGLSWNGADIGLLLGQADPLQALVANQEYFLFLGSRRGQLWYNTGNAGFPFAIESGAFIEVGTNAPASAIQADSTLFWIGQDARGANVAMRLQGLRSQRISTHAVEFAWSNKDPDKGKVYPTTADCICYAITWNGHQLVRYIFPTADAGWEYDITESARVGYDVWEEISFTDGNGGTHAPLERAHCYAFGLHLIGSGGADGAPGAIYQIDASTYADAVGSPSGRLVDRVESGQILGDLSAVAVSIFDAQITSVPAYPAPPFYFLFGEGTGSPELVLCTALSPLPFSQATLTIQRAQGGTIAQAWATNTPFQLVSSAGFPLTRDRIVRLPWNGGLRQFLDRLEFFVQPGVGLDSGQGADPVMLIRISRDGGRTWGAERQIRLGAGGQYGLRAIANRLGSYRDGALWVRITDPVFAALIGADHYIRAGVS